MRDARMAVLAQGTGRALARLSFGAKNVSMHATASSSSIVASSTTFSQVAAPILALQPTLIARTRVVCTMGLVKPRENATAPRDSRERFAKTHPPDCLLDS